MGHTYNKAVRDKIPDIMRSRGEDCKMIVLSDEKFLAEMEKKLFEEVREYDKDRSIDELADILEVVSRIAELKGTSKERLEEIRRDKAAAKGAFQKNLFLVETRAENT